jgi:hypothetical protein
MNVYQPIEEVERALVTYMREQVLWCSPTRASSASSAT